MNEIENLKKLVNVNIEFIAPKELEKLAKNLKKSDKFPDIKSSFEFPPKSLKSVIEYFLKGSYDKLNFFDIARLLTHLENDDLGYRVKDKLQFAECLQELFKQSEKYIQNLILRVTTKIFLQNMNSFIDSLEYSLVADEFVFMRYCYKKNFSSIEKVIKNKNLKKVLRFYGVHKIFSDLVAEYSNYLLEGIGKNITKETTAKYKNNLLNEDDIKLLYNQVDRLVSIVEDKKSPAKSSFIDELLISKLGNIEDSDSEWQTLAIPPYIQEKYKRLKGLFEFQRFVDIANYLAKYTDLSNSNLSASGKTSDAMRIISRSDFWSNYDERFTSVKIWVNEEDFKVLSRGQIVDLNDIKILKDFENEACMLEFKESNLLIIEFFRQRDNDSSRKSLIFDGYKVGKVKEMLIKYDLSFDLLYELEQLSSFRINHDFLWQGWVDQFLRDRNIYPNESILNGKKFRSYKKVIYKKEIGLQSARDEALMNERKIPYSNVIWSV